MAGSCAALLLYAAPAQGWDTSRYEREGEGQGEWRGAIGVEGEGLTAR